MSDFDLDAALAAEEGDQPSFIVKGQRFRCVPIDDLPWTAGIRLSAAPDDGPEAEAAIGKWFDAVLVAEDRERFAPVLESLGGRALKRLMEYLGTTYSGRPTSGEATPPRSSSPDGSSGTGATAKVVRLFSEEELATGLHRAASGG